MRAFRVAYDGREYRGFQRQPHGETVEDALFDGLRALDVLATDADKPAGYAAAGRTDAGVSALAQTVAFETPDWLTPRAFNAELPAAIRAWATADAPADFHATHHASERTYRYHLYAPETREEAAAESADTVAEPAADRLPAGAEPTVHDDRIAAACEALSGSHDYHNLTSDDRGTERTLSVEATRDGPFVALTVRAGGFPRQLVRRLVTLVEAVGRGAEPLSTIDRVLAPEPLPGHEGIAPAPPEPLVLVDVTYPDLSFAVDESAARTARECFGRRRRDHLAAARVATSLRDGIGDG